MNKQLNHKIIILIIFLDLVWSIMAVVYDREIFSQIPIYLWPFLSICPVFPTLLSVAWLQTLRDKPNTFLLAFSALPSLVYLFAAIIYYPTWMILNGFDWMTFGAIFWVLAYGVQGVYLLSRYRIKRLAVLVVGAFLVFSLALQCSTQTYGAQDFANFSPDLYFSLYFIVTLFAMILSSVLYLADKKR